MLVACALSWLQCHRVASGEPAAWLVVAGAAIVVKKGMRDGCFAGEQQSLLGQAEPCDRWITFTSAANCEVALLVADVGAALFSSSLTKKRPKTNERLQQRRWQARRRSVAPLLVLLAPQARVAVGQLDVQL